MPTIIRQFGFDIRINTRDHTPAHVHCFKAGAELIVFLETLSIRENNGMSRVDVNQVLSLVAANQALLLAAWNRIRPS